jgi:RNA polymerase sigma-70 factor, ECF subfamily
MVAETRSVGMEAFEAEALPHFDDLYRTAVRVIGDRAEAEDLVQEAYLQAWKSFHRFELGTNCRAWLFKILFHVIHHHRRKWFNFKWVEGGEEHLKESLAYEPPIPEQITDEDLLAALNQVPEAFREVILLVDVQEFSYKEISEILKIPIGTVMSRLSRGRLALRTHLTSSPTQTGFQRAEVAHKSAQLG